MNQRPGIPGRNNIAVNKVNTSYLYVGGLIAVNALYCWRVLYPFRSGAVTIRSEITWYDATGIIQKTTISIIQSLAGSGSAPD